MSFIDLEKVPVLQLVAGCRLRAAFGERLMLSYLEMEEGAVVPLHSHPHEQGGILLKGRLELTIGGEVRVVEAGGMYLIPGGVPHRAVAVGGRAVVLDVFSPVREDYAGMSNAFVKMQNAE